MSEWTHAMDTELRRRWAAGQTASKIAAEMRVASRSAVLGRVHRLKLDRRPSPIKADQAAVASKRAATVAMTRPERLKQARERAAARDASRPATKAAPKPTIRPTERPNPYRTCQYLNGEAKLRAFCGAATVPGHSWCEAHCLRVYQPRDVAAEKAEAA